MQSIINKIFLGTKQDISEQILDFYQKNNFCIVNFIYFANLHKFILNQKDKKYLQALQNGTFLLPDGIALKIYLKKKYNKEIKENLNGTDFTPYFLNFLKSKNKKINLTIYTVYDEKIGKQKQDVEKVEKYIKDNFQLDTLSFVSHYKNRGKDFDFDKYRQSLKNNEINLFLVGLGSPFQEIWIEENRKFFKENNILIINVGGLFDFWAGFEKRAPKLFLKLNLEWLWRLGQSPKKNYKKVIESFKLFKEILKK